MTTRTFTLTLDDGDRLMILTALGFAATFLSVGYNTENRRRPVNELIERLSSVPGQDVVTSQPPAPNSGTEAARAILAPASKPTTLADSANQNFPPPREAMPTDYFAADKKGNIPMKAPNDAELSQVRIVSAQQLRGKEYLTVIFAAGTTTDGRVRPAGKANCFDKQLWPAIKNREGQVASLWIAESGNYLNIVGVRA